MIFTATAVVSVAAAFFAASLNSALLSLPFLCCAGMSLLSNKLVERYFNHDQAIQRCANALRDQTEILGATERALAQANQRHAQRSQENGELQVMVEQLELDLQNLRQENQARGDQLQKEERQIADLDRQIQTMRGEHERHVRLQEHLQQQLRNAEGLVIAMRREREDADQLRIKQQRLNDETHRRSNGAQALHSQLDQLKHQVTAAGTSIDEESRPTEAMKEDSLAQGEALRQLEERLNNL